MTHMTNKNETQHNKGTASHDAYMTNKNEAQYNTWPVHIRTVYVEKTKIRGAESTVRKKQKY